MVVHSCNPSVCELEPCVVQGHPVLHWEEFEASLVSLRLSLIKSNPNKTERQMMANNPFHQAVLLGSPSSIPFPKQGNSFGGNFGARRAPETGWSLWSPDFWKGIRAWVQQTFRVTSAPAWLSQACLSLLGRGWRWGVGRGRVLGPDTPPPTLKRASLRRTGCRSRSRGLPRSTRSPALRLPHPHPRRRAAHG